MLLSSFVCFVIEFLFCFEKGVTNWPSSSSFCSSSLTAFFPASLVPLSLPLGAPQGYALSPLFLHAAQPCWPSRTRRKLYRWSMSMIAPSLWGNRPCCRAACRKLEAKVPLNITERTDPKGHRMMNEQQQPTPATLTVHTIAVLQNTPVSTAVPHDTWHQTSVPP